jgi:hypothetical protein
MVIEVKLTQGRTTIVDDEVEAARAVDRGAIKYLV